MRQRINHAQRRAIADYVALCHRWGEPLHYTIDRYGVLIVDSNGAHAQALRARPTATASKLPSPGENEPTATPCGSKPDEAPYLIR